MYRKDIARQNLATAKASGLDLGSFTVKKTDAVEVLLRDNIFAV